LYFHIRLQFHQNLEHKKKIAYHNFHYQLSHLWELNIKFFHIKRTIYDDLTTDIVKKIMYIFGRMNLASKKSSDMFIHIYPKKWKVVTYLRTNEKLKRLKAKTNFNVTGSESYDIQESKSKMY
jgi:hypothetical protein